MHNYTLLIALSLALTLTCRARADDDPGNRLRGSRLTPATKADSAEVHERQINPPGARARFGSVIGLFQSVGLGSYETSAVFPSLPLLSGTPGGALQRVTSGAGLVSMRGTSTGLGLGVGYNFSPNFSFYIGGQGVLPTNSSESPAKGGSQALVESGVTYSLSRAARVGLTVINRGGSDSALSGSPGGNAQATLGSGVPDPAPTGGSEKSDSTVVSLKSGFEVANGVEFGALVPYGFKTGLGDPALGISLMANGPVSASGSVSLRLSLQGTVPLSSESQSNKKVTTLTFGLSPSYQSRNFLVGINSGLSASFYTDSTTDAALTPPAPPSGGRNFGPPGGPPPPGGRSAPSATPIAPVESLRGVGSVLIGARLSDKSILSSSIETTITSRSNQSQTWSTRATVLGLQWSPGDVSFAGALTMGSVETEGSGLRLPDRPGVAFSLRYQLGDTMAASGGRPFPVR